LEANRFAMDSNDQANLRELWGVSPADSGIDEELPDIREQMRNS
jgi:hypothetical protein